MTRTAPAGPHRPLPRPAAAVPRRARAPPCRARRAGPAGRDRAREPRVDRPRSTVGRDPAAAAGSACSAVFTRTAGTAVGRWPWSTGTRCPRPRLWPWWSRSTGSASWCCWAAPFLLATLGTLFDSALVRDLAALVGARRIRVAPCERAGSSGVRGGQAGAFLGVRRAPRGRGGSPSPRLVRVRPATPSPSRRRPCACWTLGPRYALPASAAGYAAPAISPGRWR